MTLRGKGNGEWAPTPGGPRTADDAVTWAMYEQALAERDQAHEALRIAQAFLYGPGLSAQCEREEWGKVRNAIRDALEQTERSHDG